MNFLEEALAILGNIGPNRQNLKILDDCRGRLVPFVGAGLSIPYGYPSWNQLLENLASHVGLQDEVRLHLDKAEFEEAAELIAETASINYLDDSLRSVFDHTPLRALGALGAVRYLPNIARCGVLTTNFDRVLEMIYEDAGRPFTEIFHGNQIREASKAIQFGRSFLLKLHGDYRDSGHRILTLSEFSKVYGSPDAHSVNLDLDLPSVLGQAFASNPLLFLGCSLKTDRTITVISRLATKLSGTVHFALLSAGEMTAARIGQLYRWNVRPLYFPAGNYGKIEEFLACLSSATATYYTLTRVGNRKSTSRRRSSRRVALPTLAIPKSARSRSITRINGYKLCYLRMTRKLSFSDLSKLSGLDRNTLRDIEKVDERSGTKAIERFKTVRRSALERLETALEAWGQLEAGKEDDSLSMYMQFYQVYKGSETTSERGIDAQLRIPFSTRVVAFDFDGTLTKEADNRTTWEKIWVSLGYEVADCDDLHRRYARHEFDHQKWCDLTKDKFRARGFSEEKLAAVAMDSHLVDGIQETLLELKRKGISLYILSGSIKQIIKLVLGDLYDLFDDVKANEIDFDHAGVIKHINGTRYDFKGKAEFLSALIAEQSLSPLDVLFVGNSSNDVYASRSGARTLCVNPHFTNADKEEHWTYAIKEMRNLQEIMRFINI
jgi:HAD superfamily phosphoserine phosphatase-like hydrolase